MGGRVLTDGADLFGRDLSQVARIEDVTDEPIGSVPYARCKRQPDGIYAPRIYGGKQRSPRFPDERGAVRVIDLLGRGRFLIFAIERDSDWMRVDELPSVTT
jgi:hypothetical protein